MGHWKKAFPSKYMQVSDLDAPVVATIASVNPETVGSADDADLKLVVRFHEDVKAVVLNLTRAEAIESIVGDPDTDTWPGHRIRLFKGTTRFQGKRVACISIEAAPKSTTRSSRPADMTSEPDDSLSADQEL